MTASLPSSRSRTAGACSRCTTGAASIRGSDASVVLDVVQKQSNNSKLDHYVYIPQHIYTHPLPLLTLVRARRAINTATVVGTRVGHSVTNRCILLVTNNALFGAIFFCDKPFAFIAYIPVISSYRKLILFIHQNNKINYFTIKREQLSSFVLFLRS